MYSFEHPFTIDLQRRHVVGYLSVFHLATARGCCKCLLYDTSSSSESSTIFRVVTSLSANFVSNLSVLASSSKRVLSSRHSQCCGFCPPDLPNFGEQLAECDDRLFNRIRRNPQHVLHSLLPTPSAASQNYGLRSRRHDRQLPVHTSQLMDCQFFMRTLYKDIY